MWTTLALVAALATPVPTPTPLKTIYHLHVSPLCTGLRQSIGPAIGKILQNDEAIARSRPLLRSYVKAVASNGTSRDLDISRMERLITPMVKNSKDIERLLNDPYVFPKRPISDSDKQLLEIRAYLQESLAEQKDALNVLTGFIDTEQLGELQAAGTDLWKQIATSGETSTANKNSRGQSAQAAGLAPTPPPSGVLNAGVQSGPDRQVDPRFQETGNILGHNPLDAFDQAMGMYQGQLQYSEGQAADLVMKAVPQCGGKTP
ncbi:MAG TPA: hypothetical protein VGR69_01610 [Candidatus Rubrimentiphilum sp.]|nr:hypothetical protein [Candidatus Rubrimentiphilum sp.]